MTYTAGIRQTTVTIWLLLACAAQSAPFPPTYELTGIATGDGSEGFEINPAVLRITALAGGADLNDDGFEEIVTSDSSFNPSVGIVNIILGRATFPSDLITGQPGASGVLQLTGVSDSDLRNARIAPGGDFNDDGIEDLVVSGGDVYVLFGGSHISEGAFSLPSLQPSNGGDGTLGTVIVGNDPDGPAIFGAVAGDVNGDGRDDLFIGSSSGKAYVLFGQAGPQPARIDIVDFDTSSDPPGFMLVDAGSSISGFAGADLNDDGTADLALGLPNASPFGSSEGQVTVLFGRSTPFPRVVSLADLVSANGGDGSEGFILNGTRFSEYMGADLTANGDLNDDGIKDLAIGNGRSDKGSRPNIYVVYGTTQSFPAEQDATDIGLTGYGSVLGDGRSVRLGFRVATGGDINGDGVDDLITSDPTDSLGASFHYVVYGAAGGWPAEVNVGALASGDGSLGFEVIYVPDPIISTLEALLYTAISDVNGDGLGDFGFSEFVVFGRADTDGDDVPDGQDNCTLRNNIDQRDTNGDGYGNACDGDFNNDCIVNTIDLGYLRTVFATGDDDGDMDGDGVVGPSDLGLLKLSFFAPPGPGLPDGNCEP